MGRPVAPCSGGRPPRGHIFFRKYQGFPLKKQHFLGRVVYKDLRRPPLPDLSSKPPLPLAVKNNGFERCPGGQGQGKGQPASLKNGPSQKVMFFQKENLGIFEKVCPLGGRPPEQGATGRPTKTPKSLESKSLKFKGWKSAGWLSGFWAGWAGWLAWAGLGWLAGLAWAGLGWAGLGWPGLAWAGLS